MTINGIAGRSNYMSNIGKTTGIEYLEQIKEKFTKATFRKGAFLPTSASSASKPAITAAQEFLNKCSEVESLAASFEKKIPKIVEANALFGNINLTGRQLTVRGYTVDRNGNLTCHGKDVAADKDFTISLGNIKDATTDYTKKIYEYFDVSPSTILLATYNL